MVAQHIVARPLQLLGQGKVGVEPHTLAVLFEPQHAGVLHGDGVAVLGVEAEKRLALTVGGTGVMEGGVVVVEDKALVGQLVECGGALLVDGVAREALQHQLNYIVPLEHTGVLIFPGG